MGVEAGRSGRVSVDPRTLSTSREGVFAGGEVKINDLKKARLLHERGYIVLPDPTDPNVVESFRNKSFKEFERHSRVGMVTEESFAKRVEELNPGFYSFRPRESFTAFCRKSAGLLSGADLIFYLTQILEFTKPSDLKKRKVHRANT